MSILISGIEMPQEKKITLTIFSDGRVYENHGEKLWGRGKDCIPWKAVPVPPHGRLIDTLWVRNQIIKQWIDYSDDSHMYKRGMEDAYEVIRNAPTIIQAEEGE